MGHAGRPLLHRSLLMSLFAMLMVACSLLSAPQAALAATTITFSNGGTATLNSDGSIEGSCTSQRSTAFALYRDGDPDDPGPSVPTPFYITMPDGQHIVAYCQDGENYAPRDGSIPFTAYPNGSSYRVWIWGNRVDVNAAEVAAWNAAGRGLYYPAQRLFASAWSPSITGDLALFKTSADPSLSSTSDAYSLGGAVYGIYSDSACTKEVSRITTDASGRAKSSKLDVGTYWVKEISPSPGFALDGSVHRFDIDAGKTTNISVSEEPQYQPISLLLTKADADTHEPCPQGGASLGGARFIVRFFGNAAGDISGTPLQTWVFETDDEGNVLMDEDHLVSGDDFFRDASGEVVLPLGTLAAQELSAPSGYCLEGLSSSSDALSEAPAHMQVISSSGSSPEVSTFEAFRVEEHVERGGLSLDKDDAETVFAQGDATLSGVVFEVVNRSEHDVVIGGTRFSPGEVVTTLVTDSAGRASTEPDLLPYGTYEVREAAPGEGYLGTGMTQTVVIDAPNTIVAVAAPFTNDVIRGGLRVGKVSAETRDHAAQGGASLAGARITVTLCSDAPALVDGSLYQPGSVVATLVTDEQGFAELAASALPYGTYEVREAEPPEGYLPNSTWSQTICIREEGAVVDISSPELSVPDSVRRGGLSFNKVEEESMASMPLVAFLITAQDDPDGDGILEQHVIVTDENGVFDSEFAPHTNRTNANDAAYDAETGEVDDGMLDPGAGIWFSGRSDRTVEPDDARGALPYGTYSVQELPCAANEGRVPVSFTLRIAHDGRTVDRGTVDNKPGPQIQTQLGGEAGKVVPAAEGPVVLSDRVFYTNLEPGTTYLFSGELVDRATGEPLGITAMREETVFSPAGFVEIEFAVDPAVLEASELVAFEELWLDGSCIASHEDLDDAGQTMSVPSLGTSLSSGGGTELASSVDETVVLTDTVSFSGLWPGESYRIEGELVDRETGEPLGICAAAGFVVEEPEGQVEIVFQIPSELVAGTTVVCFETLVRDGHALAEHADPDDPAQTIAIPAIGTTLATADGAKTLTAAEGIVELVDTVSYRGLAAGLEYRLVGTLVDRETGEAVAEDAEVRFSPDGPCGSVEVAFAIDADACAGRELVAFEELYCGEALVARHADISDEGQTVRCACMGTQLADAGGNTGVVAASPTTVLVDTVAYRGLTPGCTYTLAGTLVDKATGEPIGVEAEAVLVPEASSGTAEVVFSCPFEAIAGKDIVAFETLLLDGDELLVHADLADEDQTVSVPRIRTQLSSGSGGRKTVEKGRFTLVDTISYENLVPGERYIVSGRLVDRKTGETFVDAAGKPATGEAALVPEERSGSCTVTFAIDASNISEETQLVAFEAIATEDGRVVATHEDLGSGEQTVTVRIPRTPGSPLPDTGDGTDPVPMRAAATAGAIIAVASTIVSIRAGSTGKTPAPRRPHRRRKPRKAA